LACSPPSILRSTWSSKKFHPLKLRPLCKKGAWM
jgi:hypothetical protein